MTLLRIFNVANMSYNAIRENKIIAKISESTVRRCTYTKIHDDLEPAHSLDASFLIKQRNS